MSLDVPLALLQRAEHGEVADALGVRQPLVSQHLRVLRSARLVTADRRVRQRLYRLVDEHVRHIVANAFQHARERSG